LFIPHNLEALKGIEHFEGFLPFYMPQTRSAMVLKFLKFFW